MKIISRRFTLNVKAYFLNGDAYGFFIRSSRSAYIQERLYSKICVRQPPLKLTLLVDVERRLSYKGTCHVILLAKLHGMYLYKTDNFFHINHYLNAVSKVALLHRVYLISFIHGIRIDKKRTVFFCFFFFLLFFRGTYSFRVMPLFRLMHCKSNEIL